MVNIQVKHTEIPSREVLKEKHISLACLIVSTESMMILSGIPEDVSGKHTPFFVLTPEFFA